MLKLFEEFQDEMDKIDLKSQETKDLVKLYPTETTDVVIGEISDDLKKLIVLSSRYGSDGKYPEIVSMDEVQKRITEHIRNARISDALTQIFWIAVSRTFGEKITGDKDLELREGWIVVELENSTDNNSECSLLTALFGSPLGMLYHKRSGKYPN